MRDFHAKWRSLAGLEPQELGSLNPSSHTPDDIIQGATQVLEFAFCDLLLRVVYGIHSQCCSHSKHDFREVAHIELFQRNVNLTFGGKGFSTLTFLLYQNVKKSIVC